MIELSSEHQHFIDAQVAAGTFRGPNEAIGEAIELLRVAVNSHQLETINSIRAGLQDAEAGRTKPLAEVAANIRAQLQARL
jgi:predicted transcriptional regulator